jgi:hypothetical protein
VLFWLQDPGNATTIGNAAARKAGKYEPVGEVRNCNSEGNRNLGQVAAAETTPNRLTSTPLPTYEFHAMLTCDKAWSRRLARKSNLKFIRRKCGLRASYRLRVAALPRFSVQSVAACVKEYKR